MTLAELIHALNNEGNKVTTWQGVETNIESVGELQGSNSDGKFFIELKTNESPQSK